jgi:predicted HTH transcriptional regulator
MLPSFPTKDELDTLVSFPYPEGYVWEYKENIPKAAELMITICAFLNTQGGYLVSGIRDIDLRMVGIPETSTHKQIDSFLLSLDDIFHQGLILHEDGTRISTSCIQAEYIQTRDGRRFMYVRVTPEDGKTYIRHCGDKYVRLSASNYKISLNRYYTEQALRERELTISRRVRRECDSVLQSLYDDINIGHDKIKELHTALDRTTRLLHTKILNDKENVEESLEKPSWTVPFFRCRLVLEC